MDCNRHLLSALRGEVAAETTGEDNQKTLALVHACYDSAAGRCVVRCPPRSCSSRHFCAPRDCFPVFLTQDRACVLRDGRRCLSGAGNG
jgi:hypothetical protein